MSIKPAAKAKEELNYCFEGIDSLRRGSPKGYYQVKQQRVQLCNITVMVPLREAKLKSKEFSFFGIDRRPIANHDERHPLHTHA